MIALYLTSFLLYRITEQIGNVGSLPILSDPNELNKWIELHPLSVVFFLLENQTSNDILPNDIVFDQIKYANYAIYKYKSKISFALSSKKLLNETSLIPSDYTIVKAYKNGREVSDRPFQPTSASFSLWCQEILIGIGTKKIIYHEELRNIFDGHQNTVIGVDGASRPSHLPKNEVFYECSSSIFKIFDINLTKGIYIYRPSDRQLVGPISGNYKKYLKSNMVDVENIYTIEPKRFIAGFFVDDRKDNTTREEIKLLNKLGDKYKKDIQFTSLEHGRVCMNIFIKGNYINMSFPFFFVLDTSALSSNNTNDVYRWAISNEKNMHDFNYLCQFVENILNGEGGRKYPHISDEIDDQDALKIVNKNFDQKVISSDDKRDKIVAFMRKENFDYRKTLITLEKIQNLLKDYIDVFSFDFSKNDIPEIVASHITRLPLIAHFPKGDEHNPLFIYPPFNFEDIVSNISSHSSMHFQVPEFDLGEMKMSIIEELGKKPARSDEL